MEMASSFRRDMAKCNQLRYTNVLHQAVLLHYQTRHVRGSVQNRFWSVQHTPRRRLQQLGRALIFIQLPLKKWCDPWLSNVALLRATDIPPLIILFYARLASADKNDSQIQTEIQEHKQLISECRLIYIKNAVINIISVFFMNKSGGLKTIGCIRAEAVRKAFSDSIDKYCFSRE